ncbi:YceI family protein [Symbiobacterium thermophilum]|uniref:YceI family protein n=1 Tax=Symbiobacterium thermophilum TaxID=2734 RepID=UPI0023523D32|nr:YceI family protein [Symbiobacterium thermophilum]
MSLALVALLAAGCARGAAQPPVEPQPAAETGTAPAAAEDSTSAGVDGTAYYVDTAQSQASYAVDETFLGQRLDVTAVGRTSALSGAIVLQDGVIQPSTVEVDLTTLRSDQSRRDNQVQRVLDTRNHPKAVFRIQGAEGDPVLTEGQEVPIRLTGTMTIKGVDRPLTFEGTAKLAGGVLTLTAQTTFAMTDFGVDPPNIANFVAVEDEVTVSVTFVGQAQS